MTAKRFRVVHSTVTQKFVVVDNEHEEIFEGIKNRDNACRFSNLLNALHEENQQIKSTIKEAYQTERTMIGKSVLKQLMETIQ